MIAAVTRGSQEMASLALVAKQIHITKELTILFPDIDECELNIHDCHEFADCENSLGSFNCCCIENFEGNGTFCSMLPLLMRRVH